MNNGEDQSLVVVSGRHRRSDIAEWKKTKAEFGGETTHLTSMTTNLIKMDRLGVWHRLQLEK